MHSSPQLPPPLGRGWCTPACWSAQTSRFLTLKHNALTHVRDVHHLRNHTRQNCSTVLQCHASTFSHTPGLPKHLSQYHHATVTSCYTLQTRPVNHETHVFTGGGTKLDRYDATRLVAKCTQANTGTMWQLCSSYIRSYSRPRLSHHAPLNDVLRSPILLHVGVHRNDLVTVLDPHGPHCDGYVLPL